MQRIIAKDLTSIAALALSAVAILVGALASSARADFGIARFDQQITGNANGDPFTQAGGHPYAITTEIDLNKHVDPDSPSSANRPDADAKDIIVDLPPGLVGNPTAIAQCTEGQLAVRDCPADSVVGTIKVRSEFSDEQVTTQSYLFPVFNMVPQGAEPATFGFDILGVAILLHGSVRNNGDFGVNVGSLNIAAALPIYGITLTFWGDPSDSSHDSQRCNSSELGLPLATLACPGQPGTSEGPNQFTGPKEAFLTLPVSCSAAGVGDQTTIRADSWVQPSVFVERLFSSHLPPGYPLAESEWGPREGETDCDIVPFKPSLAVSPTSTEADTPSGLNIDVSLPQDGLLSPSGIATADVEKTVVTLPAGIAVSPSAASGLQACSLEQIGLHTGTSPSCPDASKLGTVEIVTPLLATPLHGFVYLAKQNENPFGSLLALYLVAEGSGVVLKLAGQVSLDPQTGQLTTTFNNSPQLPFDELKVGFNGGPRAPLVTPHECGTFAASAVLTPWSGTAPVEAAGSFQILSGPHGSACPNRGAAFAPAFQAGTTNIQAGAFSPFTLAFTREDGQQQLGELEIKTPPGLLGTLSSVPLCPEPQAAQGACPAASQIGSMTVGAGAGPNPVYVYGGKVFLTGGYKGAPFGLSIVQEAVAGPFDLGLVVVRAAIRVDPHTAALTISSDPLPTSLQGIPLDLRVVNVSIDRPGFIFNPTNCAPMKIEGTLTSGQGAAVPVASDFQVTNCATLAFKPKFTVSTSGKTSRADGASLDAKIVYPPGAQANIAKVKVALPKQLPSRLTTLQKACTAAAFNADPGSCPAASVVGIARASTPVLPVGLSGPVYFVSNGGEAFPNLVVVLQGYGVRVDLVGNTFISKTGITSSTFNTIPDVPISSFELYLPEGPYSALAANGNLCKSSLRIPTEFTAQNGRTLDQSTSVAVTGCPKAKHATRARRGHTARSRRRSRATHSRRRVRVAGASHHHGTGRSK